MAMTRLSRIPVIIVKRHFKREENETKGFNFACCIDGSDKSLESFPIAKILADHKEDKVK